MKTGNTRPASQSFNKGIDDLLNIEEEPTPYSNIIKSEVAWQQKSATYIVLHLEEEDIPHMNDRDKLRQKYLLDTYYPTLSLKSRAWMKTLMIQKGWDITHYWGSDNHSVPPNFSKCIIKEVIKPREWAINPNQELPLVKSQTSKEVYLFNYWDYKEAFYNTLYQNSKIKHTWLIKLCPEAVIKGLPLWFYDWWAKYGADLSILPEPITKLFSSWVDSHPVISKMSANQLSGGLSAAYFFAEAEIPWIWNWSYQTEWTKDHLPVLTRIYHNKWWSGINTDEKMQQIGAIIEKNKAVLEASISTAIKNDNPMIQMAKMLQRKYPQETLAEIQQRCLEHMKRQFFEAFDSSDSNSTDTILPDVQDPDADLWTAAMGIIGDHNQPPDLKGKGIA